MLDALFLGNHNWILPSPIVSTPLSCFLSVQELLLIFRHRVACFADSFFRRLFSLVFEVSLIFVSGTIDSSCRRVFDDRNLGWCFLDMLGLGGVSFWSGRFMCPFTSLVFGHGIDSPFLYPFVVVCLQYGERSRRDFH